MTSSIIYSEAVWSDEELYRLSIDSKLLYFFFLSGPERKYINVFAFRKRFVSAYTGLNDTQIDVALELLVERGFVEVYENYICIKKMHVAKVGGPYGAINTDRELQKLPDDIREHFYPNNKIEVAKPVKKVKSGPAPETIKQIISRQPESLQEPLNNFVEDRKERKKPPTTRAVKGWISKLEELYPNDPRRQAACIQQSIDNSWMGLFTLKEDKQERREFL